MVIREFRVAVVMGAETGTIAIIPRARNLPPRCLTSYVPGSLITSMAALSIIIGVRLVPTPNALVIAVGTSLGCLVHEFIAQAIPTRGA